MKQSKCSVNNCVKPVIARTYCHKHYKRWQQHGSPYVTFGQNKYENVSLELYQTWRTMIRRCYEPTATGYKYYGAKGVRVCKKWQDSYIAFVKDMGSRPDKFTLDRIDPFGDYEPSNCRWADRKTQTRNQRKNVLNFLRNIKTDETIQT